MATITDEYMKENGGNKTVYCGDSEKKCCL